MVKSATKYKNEIPSQRKKLEAVKKRLRNAEVREISRWHKLASKHGLLDHTIPDEMLESAFADLSTKLDVDKDSVVFSLKQKVNRTELKLSSMTTQHRKQDTREKIQLGGLVVKAGLRDEDKAIILGALLEVTKAKKNNDEAQISAWEAIGSMALKKK